MVEFDGWLIEGPNFKEVTISSESTAYFIIDSAVEASEGKSSEDDFTITEVKVKIQ